MRPVSAVLACQFDKKVFERPLDRIHGNHFPTRQPYLLDGLTLIQRRHSDLDVPILLRPLKQRGVNSTGGDDKALLRLQQLGDRAYARDPAANHNYQAIAYLLDFGKHVRAQADGLSSPPTLPHYLP